MEDVSEAQGSIGDPTPVSEDGEAAHTAFTFNFGKNGWTDMPDIAEEVREITEIDGDRVHMAGFGGQASTPPRPSRVSTTRLIGLR